jgi:hypothetical protein
MKEYTMKEKGLFGAALFLASAVLFSCSSPVGSGGIDPKADFMDKAVAFVFKPESPGPNPNMVPRASTLGRLASGIPGGGVLLYSSVGDYIPPPAKWHTGDENDPYATYTIKYLKFLRFVGYPKSSLQGYLKDEADLLDALANSTETVSDLLSGGGDVASGLQEVKELWDDLTKKPDYIYVLVQIGFPYPGSFDLEIHKPEMLNAADVPVEAYETMPVIAYTFMDSDERVFVMSGAYDLIDTAGKVVKYKVREYTPPDGPYGGSYPHNIPKEVDEGLAALDNPENGWTREDKGEMNAIEIITTYLERGSTALGQSVFLGGRAINAFDIGKYNILYIERTSPYTYPDWSL